MFTQKISIIVPVYKVEKYLQQCIESVLAQSYKNFELLLINDGSPDSSGIICDKYAVKDARIKVFHKENGGVSSARNLGLQNMTGEWVCFLDSDDWWEPTFLQNFIELAEDGKCDIAMQGYIEENEINNTRQVVSLPNRSFSSASELIVFLERAKGIHNGFLWHRMFKAHIFKEHNILFPLGVSFAEDGDVFFRYMQQAASAKATNKCGYHYRKIEGSLTSTGKNVPEATLCYLMEAYAESITQIMQKENPTLDIIKGLKLYLWRLLSSWHIERCTKDYSTYSQRLEYIQGIITKYKLNKTCGLPLDIKALSVMCKKKPTNHNLCIIKAIIKYREIKQRIKNKL